MYCRNHTIKQQSLPVIKPDLASVDKLPLLHFVRLDKVSAAPESVLVVGCRTDKFSNSHAGVRARIFSAVATSPATGKTKR